MGQAKTSYTELSVLADCEEKWKRRYTGPKVKNPPSLALATGLLTHGGVNTVWTHGDFRTGLQEAIATMTTEWPDLPVLAEAVELADWLLRRYVEVYADFARNIEVIEVEKRLQAKVPGSPFSIYGYVDRMVEINGKLWLVETKTMKDWSRLDLVDVDPQQTLYFWLAQQNGLEPHGILFDAIRTFRWALEKPTQKVLIEAELASSFSEDRLERWRTPEFEELFPDLTPAKRKLEWARAAVEAHPGVETHAAHESFNQVWLDRTPAQIEMALKWARGLMRRRSALKHGATAARNIGPFCKSCFHKDDCFEDFAFPQQFEITMELD
jgi:hypothetical protein